MAGSEVAVKVKVEFNVDNAAFEDNQMEVEEVLDRVRIAVVGALEGTCVVPCHWPLRDSNGNTIGQVRIVR